MARTAAPVFEVRIASMGPRLVNRGNAAGAGDLDHLSVASMGPRLVNRGNEEELFGAPAPERLQWGRD